MAWRFFKKLEPNNQPVLGNGASVKFTSLDHITAYFGTDNPYVQGEFERLMAENRYGITEITEKEFHSDYVEVKKNLGGRPLKPLWREEVGSNRPMTDTVFAPPKKADPVAAVVEAEVARQLAARAIPVTGDVPPEVPTMSTPSEFKPPTAKRSKMKGVKPTE